MDCASAREINHLVFPRRHVMSAPLMKRNKGRRRLWLVKRKKISKLNNVKIIFNAMKFLQNDRLFRGATKMCNVPFPLLIISASISFGGFLLVRTTEWFNDFVTLSCDSILLRSNDVVISFVRPLIQSFTLKQIRRHVPSPPNMPDRIRMAIKHIRFLCSLTIFTSILFCKRFSFAQPFPVCLAF